MTGGLLDFFVLEASECVERLDGLLARAGGGAPDAETFARNARALRGSATMAKVAGIAGVATGLERIAKGLREGNLHWNEMLRGAVTAAIDDLKILIRGVRTWGSAEERRAADRTQELEGLAPVFRRSGAVSAIAGGSAGFLAAETAEVAAGLLRFADNPGPISTFEETLRRVRALRGVASLNDLPPLAEVVAAVDDAAKRLELGAAPATDTDRALFRAAAAVMREGADAVRQGGRPDLDSPAVQAFTSAAATFVDGSADADEVVPISSLFPDSGGPHVTYTAPNPPTTPTERFRMEVVSHAEHLRRLVFDARAAADPAARQRLGRELRGAARSLGQAAESFGEDTVAATMRALADGAALLDASTLATLEDASAILTAPGTAPIAPRFEALQKRGAPAGAASVTPRAATPLATPVVATPAVASQPSPIAAPSGPALHDMLGAGIAGLAQLADEPLSEPVPIEDDGVVPVQDLLYRGRAALDRAIQLGDALKRASGAPDAESLAELFDLLELAAVE